MASARASRPASRCFSDCGLRIADCGLSNSILKIISVPNSAIRNPQSAIAMAEPCKNCGSELFAGQRFCRACGNPTDTLDSGEAPTQPFADDPLSPQGEATTRRMPPPEDWGARHTGNTAPQSRADTNPVGKPPAAYQAP